MKGRRVPTGTLGPFLLLSETVGRVPGWALRRSSLMAVI